MNESIHYTSAFEYQRKQSMTSKKQKESIIIVLFILSCHIGNTDSFGFIHNTRIKYSSSQPSKLSSVSQSSITTTDDSTTAATATTSSSNFTSPSLLRKVDNRPHEQRVKKPRKARRLNHSFMHLYRHDEARFDDQQIAPSLKSY